MSADNWTYCPKCESVRKQNIDKMVAKVAKAYGKVDVVKYESMKQQLANLSNTDEIEQTLREDFSIGTADKFTFNVEYRCSCEKCNFKFKYSHTEPIGQLKDSDQ